jgi:hypothetical protein
MDNLLPEKRFKPGQSGNPGGKGNARSFLQREFVVKLAKDFEEHGPDAIVRCREKDPGRYLTIIASLMPKQTEQALPLEDVTDDELLAGIALLRARLTGSSGEGERPPAESAPFN